MLVSHQFAGDIVVVGFPKCGTSALGRSLEADDEISLLRTPQGGLEVTWPMFRDLATSEVSGCILAHKFTAYIYNRKALTYLRDSNPERLFVLCVRDPRRALVSWHNMHRKIADTGRNPEHFAYRERDFYGQCSIEEYYERFAADKLRYDLYFENLLSIVGKERIVVVAQESMAQGVDAIVQYLKACARGQEKDFFRSDSKNIEKYAGFADRAKMDFSSFISDELEEVYRNLMKKTEESGVRKCL